MALGGLSRIRKLAGVTLVILSFCMLFVVIYVLLKSALFGTAFIPANVLKIASTSFILLVASHLSLKTKIFYWFIPAQAFAFAAIIVGLATVISMALENWQLLLTFSGLMGISGIAVGFAINLSANRLLVRYSPRNA